MVQKKEIPGSVVIGNPVGGDQGSGTLNAEDLFINGENIKSGDPLDSLFNPSNKESVQVSLTSTSLTNVYQYTGTGRALITSIIAANKNGDGGTESEISFVITDDSDSTDYSIGNLYPIPAGTSLEVIKEVKVLEPNDFFKVKAEDASVFDVYATIAEFDDNSSLFNSFSIADASAEGSLVSIYDETNTDGSVIESILLTSVEDGENGTLVDLVINDGSTDNFLTFELNIPEKTSVEICEKPKFIPDTGSIKIRINSGGADNIETHVSGRTL